ncbi:MAG: cupin domain-containing protein [Christensenellaceae bacterium]|jgi:mannose-6-phosphate isomerase-like protein (cupin superfamily)
MHIPSKAIRRERSDREMNGQGHILTDFLLEGESLPSGANMFAVVTIGQDCSIGKHVHEGETEVYYCLSGKGSLDDNGEAVIFRPGDIHTCGGGAYHTIVNDQEEPLRFLVAIVSD